MSTFALMIELSRHIEILLLDNDCVIVPDLGGFMAHHVDAHYDEEENIFLPPLRTLGFNPLLKLNDSLLAQSYIEAYDISYPEATRRIEEEVNELKQHLRNKGVYELEDIGTLRLNDEGNYIFEPCEAGILTPTLYGLSSFEMKRTEAAEPERAHRYPACGTGTSESEEAAAPTNTHASASGYAKQKDRTTVTAADDANASGEEEEERTIKIKVAWLRNIAAVAAAIIVFLVLTPPIANSDKTQLKASGLQEQMIMNLIQENAAPRPAIEIEPAKIKKAIAERDTTTQAAHDVKPKPEHAQPVLPAKKDSMYCIVMASHITRHNANAYVKELHDKGLDEAYTYEHNKIVRVVYGKYESESEAHTALRAIRGNKYFEQSWVYKKR